MYCFNILWRTEFSLQSAKEQDKIKTGKFKTLFLIYKQNAVKNKTNRAIGQLFHLEQIEYKGLPP